MSIRTRVKFEVSISSDSNEAKDLGYLKGETFTDFMGEGGAWKTVLPKSTTNMLVTMPNIAEVKILLIKVNSVDPTLTVPEITIRRNSNGAEEIKITPYGATSTSPKESWLFLTTSGLTSIYSTNPSSTTDVNLTIFMAGD